MLFVAFSKASTREEFNFFLFFFLFFCVGVVEAKKGKAEPIDE